jgi:hypothetical protein
LIQIQNLAVVFLLLFVELVPLIDRRLQNLQMCDFNYKSFLMTAYI